MTLSGILLIDNATWGLYHSPILSVPSDAKGMLVPSHLKSNKIKDELSPCGLGGDLGETSDLLLTSDQLHRQVELSFLSVTREVSALVARVVRQNSVRP